ncbi:glycosyltransferase [Amycolatopsis sp. NPDC059021]|uniref:WXG100-like domain-containing protein n=1 Tax=Amycolatopsis sp. NPDC059021 TaxID=3346704 RepID=UPI00366C29F2
MSLQIPSELTWLVQIVGGDAWPEGDEDKLRVLAVAWEEASRELTAVQGEVDSVTAAVLSALQGTASEEFRKFTQAFKAQVPDVAVTAKQLGDLARETALQVEYAKYMIVGTLIMLAMQIAWALANAFWTFGASTATIPAMQAAARISVQVVLKNLVMAVLFGIVFQVGMDAAIQGIQMLKGDRTKWDTDLTKGAAIAGAIGGVIGFGLGAAGKRFAPKFSHSIAGEMTKGGLHEWLTEQVSGVVQGNWNGLNPAAASAGAIEGAVDGIGGRKKKGGGTQAGKNKIANAHVEGIDKLGLSKMPPMTDSPVTETGGKPTRDPSTRTTSAQPDSTPASRQSTSDSGGKVDTTAPPPAQAHPVTPPSTAPKQTERPVSPKTEHTSAPPKTTPEPPKSTEPVKPSVPAEPGKPAQPKPTITQHETQQQPVQSHPVRSQPSHQAAQSPVTTHTQTEPAPQPVRTPETSRPAASTPPPATSTAASTAQTPATSHPASLPQPAATTQPTTQPASPSTAHQNTPAPQGIPALDGPVKAGPQTPPHGSQLAASTPASTVTPPPVSAEPKPGHPAPQPTPVPVPASATPSLTPSTSDTPTPRPVPPMSRPAPPSPQETGHRYQPTLGPDRHYQPTVVAHPVPSSPNTDLASVQRTPSPTVDLVTSQELATLAPDWTKPGVGLEFQTFLSVHTGTGDARAKTTVLSDVVRGSDGKDHTLWELTVDNRDKASTKWLGTDGKPIGKSTVLEYVTQPVGTHNHQAVLDRITTFNTVLADQLVHGGGQVDIAKVWDAYRDRLKRDGKPRPIADQPYQPTLKVGRPNEAIDIAFQVRPQATFDSSLAALPKVLKEIADTGFGREATAGKHDLQADLKARIAEFDQINIPGDTKGNVKGLASLAHLYLTLDKQGFGVLPKGTVQQKPYHHFMVRRDFHGLWQQLSDPEKVLWQQHLANLKVSDNQLLYPENFKESSRITARAWLDSIADPATVLFPNAKLDKNSTPWVEQIEDVVREDLKGRKTRPAPAITDLLADLKKGNDILGAKVKAAKQHLSVNGQYKIDNILGEVHEHGKDLVSALTGEAIGKMPKATDPSRAVTFEWRGMADVPGGQAPSLKQTPAQVTDLGQITGYQIWSERTAKLVGLLPSTTDTSKSAAYHPTVSSSDHRQYSPTVLPAARPAPLPPVTSPTTTSTGPVFSAQQLTAALGKQATPDHPKLGKDPFGVRRAPEAPDFLGKYDYAKLHAGKRVDFFRKLDLLGPKPEPSALRPGRLTEHRDRVTEGALVGRNSGWGVKHQKVPHLVHSIWMGGALFDDGGARREFRDNIAQSAKDNPDFDFVVWTDVAREDIEQARSAEEGNRTPRQRDVAEMAHWAEQHNVRLVNLDEVFTAQNPMVFDAEVRTERARGNPAGWASASDLIRLEILNRFGGVYTDGDNTVRPPEPGARSPLSANVEQIAGDKLGFGLSRDRDGRITNSALVAAAGTTAVRRYLDLIGGNLGKSRLELFGLENASEATKHRVNLKENVKDDTIFRTGPHMFTYTELANQLGITKDQFPQVPDTVVHVESSQSWLGGSARQPAFDQRTVLDAVKGAVTSLHRELAARPGYLFLAPAARTINRLPEAQREAAWHAVLDLVTEVDKNSVRAISAFEIVEVPREIRNPSTGQTITVKESQAVEVTLPDSVKTRIRNDFGGADYAYGTQDGKPDSDPLVRSPQPVSRPSPPSSVETRWPRDRQPEWYQGLRDTAARSLTDTAGPDPLTVHATHEGAVPVELDLAPVRAGFNALFAELRRSGVPVPEVRVSAGQVVQVDKVTFAKHFALDQLLDPEGGYPNPKLRAEILEPGFVSELGQPGSRARQRLDALAKKYEIDPLLEVFDSNPARATSDRVLLNTDMLGELTDNPAHQGMALRHLLTHEFMHLHAHDPGRAFAGHPDEGPYQRRINPDEAATELLARLVTDALADRRGGTSQYLHFPATYQPAPGGIRYQPNVGDFNQALASQGSPPVQEVLRDYFDARGSATPLVPTARSAPLLVETLPKAQQEKLDIHGAVTVRVPGDDPLTSFRHAVADTLAAISGQSALPHGDSLEGIANAANARVHVLERNGEFTTHGPITGEPVHVVRTEDGRFLATREDVHIGRPGVSYPGPSRNPVPGNGKPDPIHRGEFEIETIAGEHFVRVYTAVVHPTEVTVAEGQSLGTSRFKDIRQDEHGRITMSPGLNKEGNLAPMWTGAGRPLRAIQWLKKYELDPANAGLQPMLRSYLVPLATYQRVTEGALHEDTGKADLTKSTNVDWTGDANQFGIRVGPDGQGHLLELANTAVDGSLVTYVTDPDTFDPALSGEGGRLKPVGKLYERLGMSMTNTDVLGRDYDPWFTWTKTGGGAGFQNSATALLKMAGELREFHLTWNELHGKDGGTALIDPDIEGLPGGKERPEVDISLAERTKRLNEFLNTRDPMSAMVKRVDDEILRTGGPVLEDYLRQAPPFEADPAGVRQALEEALPTATAKALTALKKAFNGEFNQAKDAPALESLLANESKTKGGRKKLGDVVLGKVGQDFATAVAGHPDLRALDKTTRDELAGKLQRELVRGIERRMEELTTKAHELVGDPTKFWEQLADLPDGLKADLHQAIPNAVASSELKVDQQGLREVLTGPVLKSIIEPASRAFVTQDLRSLGPEELRQKIAGEVLPELESSYRSVLSSHRQLAAVKVPENMADSLVSKVREQAERALATFTFTPVNRDAVAALMAKVPDIATQAVIGGLLAADYARMKVDFNTGETPFPNDFHRWNAERGANRLRQQEAGRKLSETLRNRSAVDLVNQLLSEFPELGRKFDEVCTQPQLEPNRSAKDEGKKGVNTFHEHAQMVLGQYLKLTERENHGERFIPVDALAKAILFHDIEKNNSKNQFGNSKARHDREPEHKLAVEMMDRYRGLWHSDRDFLAARRIVDSDPFGAYFKANKEEDVRQAREEAFRFITELAHELDPGRRPGSARKLFEEFHQYYQADFSSYTEFSGYQDKNGETKSGPPHFNQHFTAHDGELARTEDGRHFRYSAEYEAKLNELAKMFDEPIPQGRSAPPKNDVSWQHSESTTAEWAQPKNPLPPSRWESMRDKAPVRTVDYEARDILRSSTPKKLDFVPGLVRYDVRRMEVEPGHWVQEYTLKVHLQPGDGISLQALADARAKALAGVDSLLNKGYRLPSGDQFHVRLEFTEDTGAHTTVKLTDTENANQVEWGTGTSPNVLAHEIAHYFGLPDEYRDTGDWKRIFNSDGKPLPGGRKPLNAVIEDGGLMGQRVHYSPTLLPRHLWRIEQTMTSQVHLPGASHALLTGPESTVRAPLDPPEPGSAPPVRPAPGKTGYELSEQQHTELGRLGHRERWVPADGWCLFHALAATAGERLGDAGWEQIRLEVADRVEHATGPEAERYRLLLTPAEGRTAMTLAEAATAIRTDSGYYTTAAGDLAVQAVADRYGMRLSVVNEDGSVTSVGDGHEVVLVRTSNEGKAAHFWATEALPEPVTETPREPVVETPAEPVTETSPEPVVETPSEPVTETPTEPVTEAPRTPTPGTPPVYLSRGLLGTGQIEQVLGHPVREPDAIAAALVDAVTDNLPLAVEKQARHAIVDLIERHGPAGATRRLLAGEQLVGGDTPVRARLRVTGTQPATTDAATPKVATTSTTSRTDTTTATGTVSPLSAAVAVTSAVADGHFLTVKPTLKPVDERTRQQATTHTAETTHTVTATEKTGFDVDTALDISIGGRIRTTELPSALRVRYPGEVSTVTADRQAVIAPDAVHRVFGVVEDASGLTAIRDALLERPGVVPGSSLHRAITGRFSVDTPATHGRHLLGGVLTATDGTAGVAVRSTPTHFQRVETSDLTLEQSASSTRKDKTAQAGAFGTEVGVALSYGAPGVKIPSGEVKIAATASATAGPSRSLTTAATIEGAAKTTLKYDGETVLYRVDTEYAVEGTGLDYRGTHRGQVYVRVPSWQAAEFEAALRGETASAALEAAPLDPPAAPDAGTATALSAVDSATGLEHVTGKATELLDKFFVGRKTQLDTVKAQLAETLSAANLRDSYEQVREGLRVPISVAGRNLTLTVKAYLGKASTARRVGTVEIASSTGSTGSVESKDTKSSNRGVGLEVAARIGVDRGKPGLLAGLTLGGAAKWQDADSSATSAATGSTHKLTYSGPGVAVDYPATFEVALSEGNRAEGQYVSGSVRMVLPESDCLPSTFTAIPAAKNTLSPTGAISLPPGSALPGRLDHVDKVNAAIAQALAVTRKSVGAWRGLTPLTVPTSVAHARFDRMLNGGLDLQVLAPGAVHRRTDAVRVELELRHPKLVGDGAGVTSETQHTSSVSTESGHSKSWGVEGYAQAGAGAAAGVRKGVGGEEGTTDSVGGKNTSTIKRSGAHLKYRADAVYWVTAYSWQDGPGAGGHPATHRIPVVLPDGVEYWMPKDRAEKANLPVAETSVSTVDDKRWYLPEHIGKSLGNVAVDEVSPATRILPEAQRLVNLYAPEFAPHSRDTGAPTGAIPALRAAFSPSDVKAALRRAAATGQSVVVHRSTWRGLRQLEIRVAARLDTANARSAGSERIAVDSTAEGSSAHATSKTTNSTIAATLDGMAPQVRADPASAVSGVPAGGLLAGRQTGGTDSTSHTVKNTDKIKGGKHSVRFEVPVDYVVEIFRDGKRVDGTTLRDGTASLLVPEELCPTTEPAGTVASHSGAVDLRGAKVLAQAMPGGPELAAELRRLITESANEVAFFGAGDTTKLVAEGRHGGQKTAVFTDEDLRIGNFGRLLDGIEQTVVDNDLATTTGYRFGMRLEVVSPELLGTVELTTEQATKIANETGTAHQTTTTGTFSLGGTAQGTTGPGTTGGTPGTAATTKKSTAAQTTGTGNREETVTHGGTYYRYRATARYDLSVVREQGNVLDRRFGTGTRHRTVTMPDGVYLLVPRAEAERLKLPLPGQPPAARPAPPEAPVDREPPRETEDVARPWRALSTVDALKLAVHASSATHEEEDEDDVRITPPPSITRPEGGA